MSEVEDRCGLAISLLSVCLLTATAQAVAEEFDRGFALYQNHCRECHESGVHLRQNSKVGSLDELRARVVAWSAHSGLGWGREDIEDVTEYLARTYYKELERP